MEQLRATLVRIALVVAAEGSPTGKITTFVTSVNDWRSSASDQFLLKEYFKGEYPSNTLVEVIGLAEPEGKFGQR